MAEFESDGWMHDTWKVKRDDPPFTDARQPITMYDASGWSHNGTLWDWGLVGDKAFHFQGIVFAPSCQWLRHSMSISCRHLVIYKLWDEDRV